MTHIVAVNPIGATGEMGRAVCTCHLTFVDMFDTVREWAELHSIDGKGHLL